MSGPSSALWSCAQGFINASRVPDRTVAADIHQYPSMMMWCVIQFRPEQEKRNGGSRGQGLRLKLPNQLRFRQKTARMLTSPCFPKKRSPQAVSSDFVSRAWGLVVTSHLGPASPTSHGCSRRRWQPRRPSVLLNTF